jgi:uncharacterized protein (DUF433 family)
MFTRITSDPVILGGKPCIKGTRISVEFVLELVASGASRDDIVRSYPQLTAEDVEEALNFAAQSIRSLSPTRITLDELLQGVTDQNIHSEWACDSAILSN